MKKYNKFLFFLKLVKYQIVTSLYCLKCIVVGYGMHAQQQPPLFLKESANSCMCSGLLDPWNLSCSSKRKDWRIASEANPKMDKNVLAIIKEMKVTTTTGPIGDSTVGAPSCPQTDSMVPSKQIRNEIRTINIC